MTTHTMFPKNFPLFLTKEAVFETREDMLWRAVGGTMSTRAAIRSKKVSSADNSEETEESDSVDELREDEEEA